MEEGSQANQQQWTPDQTQVRPPELVACINYKSGRSSGHEDNEVEHT
jgi:hypothetical protein